MTCYQTISCPTCGNTKIKKAGTSAKGVQRYICQTEECSVQSFMLDYCYRAYEPGVKKQVIDMAINGSGVRDTARVLNISKGTVMSTLKKRKKYRSSKPKLSSRERKICD